MYAESRREMEMPSGTSGVGSSIQIVIVTDRGFGRKRRPSAFEQICVAGVRVAVRKLVITQFYQITIQRLTVTALIKITRSSSKVSSAEFLHIGWSGTGRAERVSFIHFFPTLPPNRGGILSNESVGSKEEIRTHTKKPRFEGKTETGNLY